MHGRSGFLNIKNIGLVVLAIFLVLGFHYHSKLKSYSVNQDIKLLQLQEKEESLNENIKAIVETRGECLRNLRSVKTELLSFKKNLQEKEESSRTQYESLRKTNEDLSSQVSTLDIKYNNLLADYGKTQSASAKSLKEVQDKLQEREEELKLLKSEKSSDLAKLRDEIANIKRENDELKEKMKSHGITHAEKKAEYENIKKQDGQVPAPNNKVAPYPSNNEHEKKADNGEAPFPQVPDAQQHYQADKHPVGNQVPEKREAAEIAPQRAAGEQMQQVPLPEKRNNAGPEVQAGGDENKVNAMARPVLKQPEAVGDSAAHARQNEGF